MKKLENYKELDICKLDYYDEDLFPVVNDTEMINLYRNIREYGVITPVIVRTGKGGRYETIAGKRRVEVCKMLGITTIPAIIKDLGDDEATIMMIDSNLSARSLRHSEKAWAYFARREAVQNIVERKKARIELDVKIEEASRLHNREVISSEADEQIGNYIQLTNLIEEIMEFVDSNKLKIRSAVELSYLSLGEQQNVHEAMRRYDAIPSYSQAAQLHKLSKQKKLSIEKINETISAPKGNQKEKIVIYKDRISPYLPHGIADEQVADYLIMIAQQVYLKKKITKEISL